MEPTILFEDDAMVVIHKPAGLIVHSDGRTSEASVAEWVLHAYPTLRDVGEPWVSPQGEVIARPGIVHRLDRTTSGVMVLAKTSASYDALKAQFQARAVVKEYRAFVYGHPPDDQGTIVAEIVRIRSSPPRWGVKRTGEVKKHREAITEWQVLSWGVDSQSGDPATYLAVSPKTGRTHQIRVHLKHLNHPVICDSLYAAGKPCILGFERPALHAYKLTLTLSSGESATFEAPLPHDFLQALSHMGMPPELPT